MENKKTKIISIVAIVALALTVITATYAYFNASIGDPAAADIRINANTVDTFTFSSGSAISFSINQDNFASGKGNITGSTYASAMLTANNKTNTATEHYYLYLNIENNTFTYSINESTPEIIMTIKNSAGAEVTDISTLNHVIVTGANNTQVSGYDITNKNGVITLFNSREITANPSKEEKWNITITFVNYDASQNANAGKSMSAKVMIQKEMIPLHESCNDNTLACHVAKLYTGTQGANGLYYHNSSLTNGAGDNSYRYAGANPDNYVCFGTTSPCPTDNLYRIIGVFGENYHGVTGKQLVKLIKYDYANGNLLGFDGEYSEDTYSKSSYSSYKGELTTINRYYWDNFTKSNTWSESVLNQGNLNQNFITNIGSEWAQKIATTTWKVGGNLSVDIEYAVPSVAYQNEIVNLDPGYYSITGEKEYSAQIGLMYVSDYYYSASSSAWTLTGYNSNSAKDYRAATTLNWMYMGLDEWTISRVASIAGSAVYVGDYGNVFSNDVATAVGVRPTFNLLSSITYAGGSGTQSDPIIIN